MHQSVTHAIGTVVLMVLPFAYFAWRWRAVNKAIEREAFRAPTDTDLDRYIAKAKSLPTHQVHDVTGMSREQRHALIESVDATNPAFVWDADDTREDSRWTRT